MSTNSLVSFKVVPIIESRHDKRPEKSASEHMQLMMQKAVERPVCETATMQCKNERESLLP